MYEREVSKMVFKKAEKKKVKTVISMLVCAMLLLLIFAPAATAAIMGDVNSDGVINVKDVTLVQKHVLSIPPALTPAQQVLADVSGDGVINVTDVSLIMRYALGLISEFPDVSLNVVSVTAINAKQVEVAFNRLVTKALAENSCQL
jgi:hypothetical protein